MAILLPLFILSVYFGAHNVIICRITPFGEPPTPRAAHVATAVGTMVVIQVSTRRFISLVMIPCSAVLTFSIQT